MTIKIVNKSKHPLPKYATPGSVAFDLTANLTDEFLAEASTHPIVEVDMEAKTLHLDYGDHILIPTGIYLEIPEGYEAQIRPRSGLALKFGATILNTPGTIDSDYRGEIGVIMAVPTADYKNTTDYGITIADGDRIAQVVISKVEKVEFEEVESLSETERGEGGFGSSGVKTEV
jgi:dUTP pyrophosphatase